MDLQQRSHDAAEWTVSRTLTVVVVFFFPREPVWPSGKALG